MGAGIQSRTILTNNPPMKKSHLTTVLETLLGDNPYNGGYPTDLITTFERDKHGRLRRAHFSVFDDVDDLVYYRAELRNPKLEEGKLKLPKSFHTSLAIRRSRDLMGCGIVEPRILVAFTEIARQELAKQLRRSNQ